MEKRLPLAIILSLLVLVLWQVINPPPVDNSGSRDVQTAVGGAERPDENANSAPGPDAPAPAPSMGTAEVEEPLIADSKPRDLTIEFGRRGEVGHFRATFENRGAQLIDLRTGTFYRRVGLTEEERARPENWLRLIEPFEALKPTAARGAFALDGFVSGEDITPRRLSEVLWEMSELKDSDGTVRGVEFRYAGSNGVLFTKRVEAVPGTWDLGLSLSIQSPEILPEDIAPGPRSFAMVASGTIGVEVVDSFYKQPKAMAVGPVSGRDYKLDSQIAELDPRKSSGVLDAIGPLALVGGHNKYFAVLLRGLDDQGKGSIGTATWRILAGFGPLDPDHLAGTDPSASLAPQIEPYIVAEAHLDLALPEPGRVETWNYRLYAGPKDHSGFVAASPAHREVLDSDLNWFSGIGNFLIDVLGVLERFTGNWGVAIILLTFCIRLLLFPLNRRSQTAMARYQKKMQRVQPKLTEIKEKYADDLQKQREAQARIMQEEGAFPPLGGCLPIFLQMPVFFGLFAALRTSFDLRHAGFAGWIQDLSRPDQLLYLGWNVPFIDLEYLNLLPPLMVVLWIWQQRTMPQPTDEQAKKMQRIMLFMPVVMGVFLYNYAAGLSLYMMTQSGLGVFEQKVIKKLWPVDDTEPEKKKSGCAPMAAMMERAAEQQRLQQKKLEQSKRQQSGSKKKKR
ncbi:membrane protein insertase YidC [Engelhardtia mirabilis]|uniref:Membrane protein insertase YidC n=1 Tax=Engelhardtia mirabilis TaxID=2528011 RepID=A0A518BJA9_9BACT|nr:Membrane protein insertase YidC [Planctomycetes bacterium Pla133]QDV01391.1 Membrane protein insertase YidC [Planctomycetes bacterium Pla86]